MTRTPKRWKWGVGFSGDKLSLDEVLRFTSMAEDAGAESVWAAELWRDTFVPLTAMATVARQIRVGTGVAHFARPPMLTELSAMSLAEYTQGASSSAWAGTAGVEREPPRATLSQDRAP
jgi:alkanesulfonate monooxygenase SsuD/methylene tetrahydromethanopterin reductase-like flavin-dependent oxidoreductase (luciferase family)